MRGWLLLVCVLLSACSRGPDAALEDYLARLTRALDVSDAEVVVFPPLAERPRRRALQLSEPELSINLLEFLQLSGCELGRALGQRNSALGRLAQPSQRLHINRDILISGPQCLEALWQRDPDLASELAALIAEKQQYRMHYWWNGWMTSQEWLAFSSPTAGYLPQGDEGALTVQSGLQSLRWALQQGVRWQQDEFAYQSSEMEQQQQQWLATAALGRWRESQRLLTVISLQAAAQLEKRTGARPLCPAGRKTPQADIVQNVFVRYYAGVMQPYLSETDRFGDALIPMLEDMGALLGNDVPLAWTLWLEQLRREKAALRDAHQLHVRKWQEVLRQCGLMPGQDTSHTSGDIPE